MKKLLALVLATMMVLAGLAALAEENTINSLVEEGSFIVQIDDPEGDLGWLAETKDESIVSIYDADLIEDTYVVRYDPVNDGDTTVTVKHYTGIACDQVYTWDLTVKDKTIVEPTGGSHTASPDPATFDATLIGQWETADGMATMSITKNPGGSVWDAEINGASSHNGYAFVATIYYDCEKDAFVYDKGKYWELPITDSEEAPALGEPTTAGMSGAFTFSGDEEKPVLTWKGDDEDSIEIEFSKAAAGAAIPEDVIERFSDTWAADGFSAEIWFDKDEGIVKCAMALSDGSFCDFSSCKYDAESDALVFEGGVHYNANFNEETADHDREVLDSDVKAVFTEKDGKLTCEDSLGQLKGVEFQHLDDAEAEMAAQAN